MEQKHATIFCDIDGTILKYRKFGTYESEMPQVIPSTLEYLKKEKANGSFIVLTSARPLDLYAFTQNEMIRCGVPFDRILLGIGRGVRYLINDKDPGDDKDRAVAINLERDSGF